MSQTTDYQPARPIQKSFDREVFNCGVEALNDYLKKFALQNQKRNSARTYAVTDSADKILGYYTLVFASVGREDVPADVSSGLGRYPIPVILLARLAVDLSEKGKGLGGFLIRDAFHRAERASDIAGLLAVMVQAKDETARIFYEKIGFRRSPSDEFKLFLTISEVRTHLLKR